MADSSSPREDRSLFHPVSSVVGIIDQSDDAQAALEALHAAGFPESAVIVVCGPQGARQLVAEPVRLGLLRRIAQIIQNPSANPLVPDARYVSAVDGGHLCVRVMVETEAQRDAARQTLKAFGGHYITYHGLNEATVLDE